MSYAMSVSQPHHSPVSSSPFVMLPISIMERQTLSSGAKYLYVCLKRHARNKGVCFPSIGLLCREMQASPNTIRKYMRQLVSAGLVTVRRRGQGRTSIYTLHSENPVRMAETAVPEAQKLRTEIDTEEIDERENAVESSSTSPISSFHENDAPPPQSLSSPPKSRYVPQPERDAVIALFGDLRTEMRDQAKLGSTSTRALNLWRRSGVTWDEFINAVYSARTATKARTHTIKSRDEFGGAKKMGYFFSLLEDRLGLREDTRGRTGTYSTSYDRAAAYQSANMTTWTGFDAREGRYRRE